MSCSRDLVKLIHARPRGRQDLEQAALFVLDTLACALGAAPTEPARIFRSIAPLDRADTARAAFHYGGLAHILEMDDLHRDSVTHPGSVVIPAALAVARRDDRGGIAFLEAVLAGYEACCRHAHPSINAAIELHARIGGAELARVSVGAYRAALDVCDRPSPQGP